MLLPIKPLLWQQLHNLCRGRMELLVLLFPQPEPAQAFPLCLCASEKNHFLQKRFLTVGGSGAFATFASEAAEQGGWGGQVSGKE